MSWPACGSAPPGELGVAISMPGIDDILGSGAGVVAGAGIAGDMSMPGIGSALAAGLGTGRGAGAAGRARLRVAARFLGAGLGFSAGLRLTTGFGLATGLAGICIPGMFMSI